MTNLNLVLLRHGHVFAVCVRRQVVVAISGFYVGLYVVFKGLSAAFSSPKKKEVGENHGEVVMRIA